MFTSQGADLGPGHTPVFTEDVPIHPICRPVICFEFVLSQLDLRLPPSKVAFLWCIFRWLGCRWMVFQEFLPSVGCRPLLQPTSATTAHGFHTRNHTHAHRYPGTLILAGFLLHQFHVAVVLVAVYILCLVWCSALVDLMVVTVPNTYGRHSSPTPSFAFLLFSARNVSAFHLKAVRDTHSPGGDVT